MICDPPVSEGGAKNKFTDGFIGLIFCLYYPVLYYNNNIYYTLIHTLVCTYTVKAFVGNPLPIITFRKLYVNGCKYIIKKIYTV